MVVRWMGAFGKKGRLESSLGWELTQASVRALSAERLVGGRSKIRHARVGLLVKNRAILRRYRGDVWSIRRSNGVLIKTRDQDNVFGGHTECFVRPDYAGIVIKGTISAQALRACTEAAAEHNLPLLKLTRDGRLVAFF